MFCFLLSIYSLSFVVCTALNVLFSVKYLFFVFRSVYCSQCFCFLLSIYSLYFVLCTALNVCFLLSIYSLSFVVCTALNVFVLC